LPEIAKLAKRSTPQTWHKNTARLTLQTKDEAASVEWGNHRGFWGLQMMILRKKKMSKVGF